MRPNTAQLFALVNRQETLGPVDPDNPMASAHLSKEECAAEMNRSLNAVLNTYKNLLSCFDNLGPYGLHSTIQAWIAENKTCFDLIDGAAAYGSARDLSDAVRLSYETAFVEAFEAQALNRLQLRDSAGKTIWNQEAQSEYFDMRRRVHSSGKGTRVYPARHVPAPAPAPVVPAERPTDQCAREFREMGSDAFRAKWIKNENNKRIWEQANAEGKI